MLKNILCKLSSSYRDKVEHAFYDAKSAWMASLLNKEHDMVMHAIIPYPIGGPVDVYMFPNFITGTVFATKEMVDRCHQECKRFDGHHYEVVMATKHDIDEADDSPFGVQLLRCRKLMTMVARYSGSAVLKSNDTIEVPMEDGAENACAILREVKKTGRTTIDGIPITLQYIIEIHRVEMEFARANGSDALITLLNKANVFPYSDMDRSSVV